MGNAFRSDLSFRFCQEQNFFVQEKLWNIRFDKVATGNKGGYCEDYSSPILGTKVNERDNVTLIQSFRYSVGGYHTTLSPLRPGFESPYRKILLRFCLQGLGILCVLLRVVSS